MSIPMTAQKALRYAGIRLQPGDDFHATSKKDAKLLAALRKATYRTVVVSAAPIQKAPEPPAGSEAADLATLRTTYQDVFGKRPFHGWDAETLRAKIAAHGADPE